MLSCAISGVVASIGSLPLDNMKTKILNMKRSNNSFYLDALGELPYTSMMDCFRKTIRNEGVLSLWVGLPAYYCRGAPHAMITLLAQDCIHDYLESRKNLQ